jgi:TolA-binding protein
VRSFSILLLVSLLAGCTTQTVVVKKEPPLRPLMAAATTKFAETRYDVRSYRDAANPSLRHEPHVIYRRTQVPPSASNELETVPRVSYPPAGVAPLPASEEQAAELATQRKISDELRAMQALLAETSQKLQAQYAQLVRQSADTLRAREQLDAERNRVRSMPSAEPAPATPTAMPTSNPTVKW